MNKVILVGRLVSDPEVRNTQSGVAVCKFNVAVDRPYQKDNNGNNPTADFISCTAWRNTAEFVGKYFSKGSPISLEGSLRNENYEKDGVKHYSYSVLVDKVEFVPKLKSDNANAPADNDVSAAQQVVNKAVSENVEIGDLSDFEMLSDGDVPF